MTSPGGTEVGRASIRVLPDVSGFRERLRAELAKIQGLDVTVNVNFDIDPEELQAQLRRLDNKIIVRARIIADDPNIDQTVTISARLNIDLAYWKAQIARINPVRLRANVDVDIDEAEISRRVRRAIRRGSADVDVDGRRGGDALNSVTNSFSLIAQFGGRWLRYLIQAFAIAPLLAIAGAAISEAWGIAAAAISAIPAALFTIAGPLSVVLLGFEGIKEGFAELVPVVEELSRSVSAQFAFYLPEAARNFITILRFLHVEFTGLALVISKMTVRFSEMLSQNAKIAQLKEIFSLVKDTTGSLLGNLILISDTLIDVATISDGYDVFTVPLREFASAFRASVSEVGNNGTLGGALRELGQLLGAVTRGFVALVENGLYLFLQAGPGLTFFLDQVTDFFNRFDWSALGASVGAVFFGLGSALRQIPQSTIDAMVVSFQKLGGLFQDQRFQSFLVDIAGYLPAIINLVKIMTEGFVRALVVIYNLGQAAVGVVSLVADSAKAIAQGWSFEEFQARNDQNWLDIRNSIRRGMEAAFAPINEGIPEQLGEAGDNIFRGFVRMDGRIQEGIQLVEGDKDFDPLQGLGEGLGLGNGVVLPFEQAAQNALVGKRNLLDSMTVNSGEVTRLRGSYDGVWGVVAVPENVFSGTIANTRRLVDQILANVQPPAGSSEQVGGAWSLVLTSIGGYAQTAIDNVKQVLQAGFGQAVAATSTGAAQIPPAADRGLSGLGGVVANAMQPATNAIQSGWSASFVQTDLGARRVVNRTSQLPGEIQRSFGGTDILGYAGRNIMNSLYNGLVSAYGRVQSFIGSIAGWIARNKGPESVDKALLRPAGRWIMEGLADGLETGFRDVMVLVQGMNTDLQDAWSINGGLFASSLTEGVPEAIASNEALLAKSNVGVSSELNAAVSAEGYGVSDEIVSALEGWQVVIDANGITKLVNKTNTRKARR